MKGQRGMTLIEMLVSLVISSVIIGGAYQVVMNQAKGYEIQDKAAEAQNAVRAAMEIMVADLRMAGYDKEGGVTVANPVSGSSNSIRVEWESDQNTIKAVQYLLSNRQLERYVYLNGELIKEIKDHPEEKVVLDNVTSLNFAYTMRGTKFVGVGVALKADNRDLSSSVIFRNLK
jgi:type II secretion system protein J